MKKNNTSFASSTQLPSNKEESTRWQAENIAWWENNPMRYDWSEKIGYPEFSKEFYQEIDRRFFSSMHHYLPWRNIPLDPLIDYKKLSSQDILEIGIGNGTHAQVLASYARSFTGIDLTDYAVTSTKARFQHAGLSARILKADAENLPFADESFDSVWSWGVIHHSSNTKKIIKELARVLRPKGKATLMVYHRGWYNYYLIGTVIHGLARGGFLKHKSLHEIIQENTDGAIARYYTPSDWKQLVDEYFVVNKTMIAGQKNEILPLPGGKFKDAILRITSDSFTRFLTNTLSCGSFLISTIEKR